LSLFVLGVLSAPAQAESRQVLGYAGVLGEWELTATVNEKAHWLSKEFSGPLSMKHVGICTSDGPEERASRRRRRLHICHEDISGLIGGFFPALRAARLPIVEGLYAN
jgi:hypothetical protein